MSFLNPRLNGKPRVVHLNCALMACGDGSTAFPQKARRTYQRKKLSLAKVREKVPLDNIAKRAESYKPKERMTYKMIKEYIEINLIICIWR